MRPLGRVRVPKGKIVEPRAILCAMSRRVHAAAVLLIAACGLVSLGAQSSCTGVAARKRAGEPCTRTSECESDLVCTSGVCRGPSDGSVDAATDQ